jgi:hypothetical protein
MLNSYHSSGKGYRAVQEHRRGGRVRAHVASKVAHVAAVVASVAAQHAVLAMPRLTCAAHRLNSIRLSSY